MILPLSCLIGWLENKRISLDENNNQITRLFVKKKNTYDFSFTRPNTLVLNLRWRSWLLTFTHLGLLAGLIE